MSHQSKFSQKLPINRLNIGDHHVETHFCSSFLSVGYGICCCSRRTNSWGDAIQSIKGSDKIFTGEVKIVPLSESVPGMPVSSAYVIFEPGARSFWHTHPTGQVLIIVEGEGRSGVYGKPVSVLKKGDVVVCPKGIKHFHGAAPDKRMVQMTVTGYDPQGKNVTWMEPVTDQQYKNSEK